MSPPAPGERERSIREHLSEALTPVHVLIEDESHNHSVPRGAQSHFKVVVVTSAFEGLSTVRRHQLVYGALRAELASGLHALSIVAKTPAEWEASQVVPESPPCLGGSKAEDRAR